jgi:protoporphyrin/coproporphyrin ferrochelatase
MPAYDAVLLLSFGGPEGLEEVMPFLERVTEGRGVPRERLEAVAEHYRHFGGVSPINARTRELLDALRAELSAYGPRLPVYWGNRFSAPYLADALRQMRADGVRRALGFATSAFASYSGCRAYLEDLDRAREELGEGAPEVDKLPPFAEHPGYVETCVARLRETLDALPAEQRDRAHVLFSAHSIPRAMAAACAYERQLAALSERVAGELALPRWRLVYQSRSGPPQVPWLEPDVLDALAALATEAPGATAVLAPIGFVADHMEVVWDLDEEARAEAERLGLRLSRAPAANAHPRFVRMIRELIEERLQGPAPGCPAGCCPAPRRP